MSRTTAHVAVGLALLVSSSASAQGDDAFRDGRNGDKVHIASGFVCPAKIGMFERDAAGQRDVTTDTDYCAYAALDGVYGTIKLTPLTGGYDPNAAMSQEFVRQEETGARKIGENQRAFGTKQAPLSVYTRTYRTERAGALDYRVLFTGAAIRNWVVETTIEYAVPRDQPVEEQFLKAVYGDAGHNIAQ